jgi:hypothetical protein
MDPGASRYLNASLSRSSHDAAGRVGRHFAHFCHERGVWRGIRAVVLFDSSVYDAWAAWVADSLGTNSDRVSQQLTGLL